MSRTSSRRLAHLPELRVGDAEGPQLVGHPVDRLGAARGGVRRRLRLRLRLRERHAVERLEAGVVRLLRAPELGLGREERREHLVLLHGVARRDALHVADPAAHGGDDRIRPVLVGRHAPGRPQQPGAGHPADDAEPDADRLLPLGTHLHRAVRERAGGGVAVRCAARAIRLEAHAADRAVAGMVAAVVRVHRAGVDGCRVRARARRARPVRPPRAAGERARGEATATAVTAMKRFIDVISTSACRHAHPRLARPMSCGVTGTTAPSPGAASARAGQYGTVLRGA